LLFVHLTCFFSIYAYEVDGFGSANLMDDANVPSLLSLPYLGYSQISDQTYQNTRKFVWSSKQPYWSVKSNTMPERMVHSTAVLANVVF
jgi:meiotically up-regulated gene 157 (Mug157) protein